MKALIVAATELEIAPLRFALGDEFSYLVHGIGAVNTAIHVLKALNNNKYDVVIQTGIAGTYHGNLKNGDVVCVKEERYADLGIEEKGQLMPLEKLGFTQFLEYPFEAGRLINHLVTKEMVTPVKLAIGATVNLVHDNLQRTQMIIDNFSPDIETMEGAAFHQVCMLENQTYFQFRGISNRVGVRDKKEWDIQLAITEVNLVVEQFLKKIQTQKPWK
jgi:futalosine hydrolase